MMIMGTNIDLCLGSPDLLLEVHLVHPIHFLRFRNKVVGASLFSALSIEQLSLRDNHGNQH